MTALKTGKQRKETTHHPNVSQGQGPSLTEPVLSHGIVDHVGDSGIVRIKGLGS